MTEPLQESEPLGESEPPEESRLSLEELESEITGAEALVASLHQRLKQTAEDRR